MTIKDAGLRFKTALTPRRETTGIVLHHLDGDGSVQSVHSFHQTTNGWNGIGYNFYVGKNGDIFNGRGMEAVGAHTVNHNSATVGIACQGRYHSHDREMPAAQYNALVWLIRHIRAKYGNIPVHGHGELRATACPGQFFPLDRVKREVSGNTAAVKPAAPAQPSAPPQTSGNDKTIWDFFTGKGLNGCGVAGLMGNLFAESGLKPNNLQNSFEKSFGMTDESYTAAVDNGTYANFVRDSAGYGLAQWTFWSRKENLLQYAKLGGKSIGDLNMQLEFLWRELQGYTVVMSTLRAATSVRQASDIVLTQYMRPADQSEAAKVRRAAHGQGYYDKFAGQAANTPDKTPAEITVDNAIADGIITDRAHWLGVLTGTIKPVPEYIKKMMDNAHGKLKG